MEALVSTEQHSQFTGHLQEEMLEEVYQPEAVAYYELRSKVARTDNPLQNLT
jgi:hypothetical protein